MGIRTTTDMEIRIGTRVQGGPGVPLPLTLLLGHPGRSHLFLLVVSGSADRSRNLEACVLKLLPPTCGVWVRQLVREWVDGLTPRLGAPIMSLSPTLEKHDTTSDLRERVLGSSSRRQCQRLPQMLLQQLCPGLEVRLGLFL